MSCLSEYIEDLGLENNICVLTQHPELFFKLSLFEEFKNVKKFNLLESPDYQYNENGEVVQKGNEDNLGESFKNSTAHPRLIHPEGEFNDEIDIYSIELTPVVYDPSVFKENFTECKIGIDKYPTIYSSKDFSTFDYIRVGYSLSNIMEFENLTREEAKEVVKGRIIRKISNLIDSDEATIRGTRRIMVRCSHRSYKQKEN